MRTPSGKTIFQNIFQNITNLKVLLLSRQGPNPRTMESSRSASGDRKVWGCSRQHLLLRSSRWGQGWVMKFCLCWNEQVLRHKNLNRDSHDHQTDIIKLTHNLQFLWSCHRAGKGSYPEWENFGLDESLS